MKSNMFRRIVALITIALLIFTNTSFCAVHSPEKSTLGTMPAFELLSGFGIECPRRGDLTEEWGERCADDLLMSIAKKCGSLTTDDDWKITERLYTSLIMNWGHATNVLENICKLIVTNLKSGFRTIRYTSSAENLQMIAIKASQDGLAGSVMSVRDGTRMHCVDVSTKAVTTHNIDEDSTDPAVNVHLAIYRKYASVNFIEIAKSEAVMRLINSDDPNLPPMTPDSVAIPAEDWIRLTTPEVGESLPDMVTRALNGHTIAFTKEFGMIAIGEALNQTRARARMTEASAVIYEVSKIRGRGSFLTKEQTEALLNTYRKQPVAKSNANPVNSAEDRLGRVEGMRGAMLAGKASDIKIDTIDRPDLTQDQIDEIRTIRQILWESGKIIAQRYLVVGPGGNTSICTKDRSIMVIKASGQSFGDMGPEDYVAVDLASEKVITGFGNALPSSEVTMHAAMYAINRDTWAVCHVHPEYATGLASSGQTFSFDEKELTKIPYVTPGGPVLGETAKEAMSTNGGQSLLMTNHGILTTGKNMAEALRLSIKIEEAAKNIVMENRNTPTAPLSTADIDSFESGLAAAEARAAIQDVKRSMREIEISSMVENADKINMQNMIVVMDGELTTFAANGDSTLIQEYKQMEQGLRKTLPDGNFIKLENGEELTGIVKALREEHPEKRVIALGFTPKATPSISGKQGEDYCFITIERQTAGDNAIPFVNLNAMTSMGVGILNNKALLFNDAYKAFTGKEAPEDLMKMIRSQIFSILPRTIKITNGIDKYETLRKLFAVCA